MGKSSEKQAAYQISLNDTGFIDVSTTNIHAKIDGTNVAVGFRQGKNRGIGLFEYDPNESFEPQANRARSLIEELLESFNGLRKPKVILAGLVPHSSGENALLDHLRDHLSEYKLCIDSRAYVGDDPIFTKDLILRPIGARIVARNQRGGCDYANGITEIDYLKIQ